MKDIALLPACRCGYEAISVMGVLRGGVPEMIAEAGVNTEGPLSLFQKLPVSELLAEELESLFSDFPGWLGAFTVLHMVLDSGSRVLLD